MNTPAAGAELVEPAAADVKTWPAENNPDALEGGRGRAHRRPRDQLRETGANDLSAPNPPGPPAARWGATDQQKGQQMNGGIYLPAPAHRAGGPDGQGWNRLSVWGSPGDQCALKPMSWASLRASRNTARFAGYGYCGPCTRRGECDGCPTLSAYQEKPRRTLMFGHPTALVRILERPGRPRELHLMDRPDQGWGSTSLPWTWAELARLPGWDIGRHFQDEHSEGFWLVATTSRYGLYGDPTWDPYTHDGSTLLGVPA